MPNQDPKPGDLTFEMKQKIANKIEKFKKIEHYSKIYDIIVKHNPGINITQTTKGQYLYFQNLTPQTYVEIEEYLTNVKTKTTGDNTSANIGDFMAQPDSEQNNDPFINKPKLRYNNREMNLIKRKQYDNIIETNDGIFAKKKQ